MPIDKRISKFSAHPDLATYLLELLIPAMYDSLLGQKGQFTLQQGPRRGLVRKFLVNTPQKVKNEQSS